jgi:hypothetical protein
MYFLLKHLKSEYEVDFSLTKPFFSYHSFWSERFKTQKYLKELKLMPEPFHTNVFSGVKSKYEISFSVFSIVFAVDLWTRNHSYQRHRIIAEFQYFKSETI